MLPWKFIYHQQLTVTIFVNDISGNTNSYKCKRRFLDVQKTTHLTSISFSLDFNLIFAYFPIMNNLGKNRNFIDKFLFYHTSWKILRNSSCFSEFWNSFPPKQRLLNLLAVLKSSLSVFKLNFVPLRNTLNKWIKCDPFFSSIHKHMNTPSILLDEFSLRLNYFLNELFP